jgi:hypothetical protein
MAVSRSKRPLASTASCCRLAQHLEHRLDAAQSSSSGAPPIFIFTTV